MGSSDYSSHDSVHFLLGIVFTASFLIFIVIMITISYCISRRRLPGLLHDHHTTDEDAKVDVEIGINETTLMSFPELLYSKATSTKLCNDDGNQSTVFSCSVCLADYDESDVLRMLPGCAHVFHLKCVDSWLRLHPTCPVCRKHPSAFISPDSCSTSTEI